MWVETTHGKLQDCQVCCHKHGDRGVLRFLVCQVLSQDHEAKKYSNIMGSNIEG